MTVAGLFAGIGGVERGLELAGFQSELLCEIDDAAQLVLRSHFRDVPIHDDIRALKSLPSVEVITAGFPCQDLSQAGRTAGIRGKNSGLVAHVFRLLDQASKSRRFKWLVLENVPFMLQLDRGKAMSLLVRELENRGFAWAYRVIDTRAFGLPQRRQRVLLVASRREDPRDVLFDESHDEPEWQEDPSLAFGFYWTEGLRGLGAAIDAIPTLKGGSTIGIPSAPAILKPFGEDVITPDIRDTERLQGFAADWTIEAVKSRRKNSRWKLVGNAVSVPVAEWIGKRLASPQRSMSCDHNLLSTTIGSKWPKAAWGNGKERHGITTTTWPVKRQYQHLHEFLKYPGKQLSARATAGFLDRLNKGGLSCFPAEFKSHIADHLEKMREDKCSVNEYSREVSLSPQ
jgi:DNA (cytosine-5)-methyltransferase 1